MKIYVLTIIQASHEDTVCLDTYVFNNLQDAKEKLNKEEYYWIELHKIIKRDIWDMSDTDFNKWLEESLIDDLDNQNGIYKSYVYDDGEEKVFSIESFDI